MVFRCECCSYKTDYKSNYGKHLHSQKHKLKSINGNITDVNTKSISNTEETPESQPKVIPKSTESQPKVNM